VNAAPEVRIATTNAQAAIGFVPSRFVTIGLASILTGFTENAIRLKIHKGVWLENRQWVKRDGRMMIDMRGYEAWVESGRA
jgi:hypothetical protein